MKNGSAFIPSITRKFRIVFKAVQTHSKTIERSCGLSGANIWMLYEIDVNPGLKVSELAKALMIHNSTCSNMLDRLEEKNLVTRDRSKKDQRSVHIYLTSSGKDILSKAPQPVQGILNQALEKLSSEQLLNLEHGLDGLTEVLHGKNEDAGLQTIMGD